MLLVDLFCTLFVRSRIGGPIIGIQPNSDNHLFGTALIINISVEGLFS